MGNRLFITPHTNVPVLTYEGAGEKGIMKLLSIKQNSRSPNRDWDSLTRRKRPEIMDKCKL